MKSDNNYHIVNLMWLILVTRW